MFILSSSRKRLIVALFAAALMFATALILINASMSYEASHSSSGAIADIISPDASVEDYEQTEFTLRKLAHLIEYFSLGAVSAALCISISRFYGRKFYGYALFYSLLVAVIDEYIQSFTGRGSTLSDVVLDLAGIVLGFTLMLIGFYLVLFIKKKNKKRLSR